MIPKRAATRPAKRMDRTKGHPEFRNQQGRGVGADPHKGGMAQGKKSGKTYQKMQAHGRDEVDQDQIHNEIVIFIGSDAEQRSQRHEPTRMRKMTKPGPLKPGPKDPLIFPVAEYGRG